MTHLQIMLHAPTAAVTITNWKTRTAFPRAANVAVLICKIGHALQINLSIFAYL